MPRFTIDLDQNITDWLDTQAAHHRRSRVKEIEAMIVEAMEAETCRDGYHIKDDNSGLCRCGRYVFVER